jgi:hypothetical protein
MDSKEIVKRQFDLQAQRFSTWSVTKNEEYMQEYFDFIGFEERTSCWMLPADRRVFRLLCKETQIELVRSISVN